MLRLFVSIRSLLWINILLSNTCQFFGIIKITHKNAVRACKHHGNLRVNPPMTSPPSRWDPSTALLRIRVANSPLTRPYSVHEPLLSGGFAIGGGTLRLPWKQGVLVEAAFVEDRPWKLLHTCFCKRPRACSSKFLGVYLNNFHPKHLMDSHPISFWCWKNLLPTNWSVSCTVVLLHLLLHQFIDDSCRNFRFHCMMRSVKDLDGIAKPLKRSKMEVLWPRKLLEVPLWDCKIADIWVGIMLGDHSFCPYSIIDCSTGVYMIATMIAWEHHGIWWILDEVLP